MSFFINRNKKRGKRLYYINWQEGRKKHLICPWAGVRAESWAWQNQLKETLFRLGQPEKYESYINLDMNDFQLPQMKPFTCLLYFRQYFSFLCWLNPDRARREEVLPVFIFFPLVMGWCMWCSDHSVRGGGGGGHTLLVGNILSSVAERRHE